MVTEPTVAELPAVDPAISPIMAEDRVDTYPAPPRSLPKIEFKMVIKRSINPVDWTMIPINTKAMPAKVTSEEIALVMPSQRSWGASFPPKRATPSKPSRSASAISRLRTTLINTVIAMKTNNANMPMPHSFQVTKSDAKHVTGNMLLRAVF